MLTAITREPSAALESCELTFLAPRPIDVAKAAEQHRIYCRELRDAGARVITLPAEADLPDSVFVEDTALVVDELAVPMPLGTPSRSPEGAAMHRELARFRPTSPIEAPARLEGGDLLRVGRRLFVGQSSRSDRAGLEALRSLLEPHGYELVSVEVSGCLHLKTGCTALDERTVLVNPDWIDTGAFEGFEKIEVADEEPFAANTLRVGERLLLAAGFPRTRARLEGRGFETRDVDISEFQKAEAGLTCLSLLFEAPASDS